MDDLKMVHNFVSEESQELWTVYDYRTSNTQSKFKAKRNGLPIIIQLLPLSKNISFKTDLDELKLCPGHSETSLVNNIDISLVLIETSLDIDSLAVVGLHFLKPSHKT